MTERAALPRGVALCEMCQRERVGPVTILCDDCVAYIRDCEAEVSEGR